MVVALVLLTFAAFVAIDILLNREKYAFPLVAAVAAEPERVGAPVVAGVRLPEHLHYHRGHTWALPEGPHRVRVGVDEFTARLLGTITRVEAPARGRWFGQGDKGWILHAANRAATLPAPVEGEVVDINEEALAHPERISADPYGRGWLLVVRTADLAVNLRNLLNGALARHWMEEAVGDLRRVLAPVAVPTAADGGTLIPGIAERLDTEQWEEATRRFFLM
jgi:glycine cleavage system H lipoate-binding protein